MNSNIQKIKQFYSQGYERVYDQGKELTFTPKKWSFHIHNLDSELVEELSNDERVDEQLEEYINALRFNFDLELILNGISGFGLRDILGEYFEDLGGYRSIAEVSNDTTDSFDFYYTYVQEEDYGNVYALTIMVEDQETLMIRTTTDGSDGWLEVFDGQGNFLASARTEGFGIAWRSLDEVRGYVLGKPRYPEELQ